MLEKTQKVLTRDPYQKNPEKYQFFSAYTEEEPIAITSGLYIQNEVWDDLGSPENVTVTIEPGDRLNQGILSERVFRGDS